MIGAIQMSTLRLEGDLTIYTVAEQRASLFTAISANRDLEINLEAVGEVDTAGLQLLLAAKRQAARDGRALRLTMHSPAVLDVLEIANMTAWFGDPVLLSKHPKGGV